MKVGWRHHLYGTGRTAAVRRAWRGGRGRSLRQYADEYQTGERYGRIYGDI